MTPGSINVNARRLEWVDCAKGIGILLVVYGHLGRGALSAGLTANADAMLLIDSLIYSFHMPLFFFLAGFSFRKSSEKRDTWQFISGKVGSLLYPYLVWSILQGIVHVLLSRWTNYPRTFQELVSIPWQPIGQFWFLLALFWLFALNTFLAVWLRRAALWVSLACAVVLYALNPPSLPFIPSQVFANLIFFNVGWLVSMHEESISRLHVGLRSLGLLALVFIAGEFWFHHAGFRYNQAPFLLRLSLALSGIALVICISGKLRGMILRIFAYLGRYSMPIYLMHILIAAGLRILLQHYLDIDNLMIHVIIIMPITLLLPIMFYRFACSRKGGWLFMPPGASLKEKLGMTHKPALSWEEKV
ncbi:MAG: acyltransferase [Pseudomonadota bacterium]